MLKAQYTSCTIRTNGWRTDNRHIEEYFDTVLWRLTRREIFTRQNDAQRRGYALTRQIHMLAEGRSMALWHTSTVQRQQTRDYSSRNWPKYSLGNIRTETYTADKTATTAVWTEKAVAMDSFIQSCRRTTRPCASWPWRHYIRPSNHSWATTTSSSSLHHHHRHRHLCLTSSLTTHRPSPHNGEQGTPYAVTVAQCCRQLWWFKLLYLIARYSMFIVLKEIWFMWWDNGFTITLIIILPQQVSTTTLLYNCTYRRRAELTIRSAPHQRKAGALLSYP